MKIFKFSTIVFLLLLAGCIREMDISFDSQIKPDVFCLLQSYDTVKLYLFNSMPINDQKYWSDLTINNANIEFFENNIFISNLNFKQNFYTLNFLPKEGQSYKIFINLENDTLVAQTYIPYHDEILVDTFYYVSFYDSDLMNMQKGFKIKFKIKGQNSNYHWFNFIDIKGLANVYTNFNNQYQVVKYKFPIFNSLEDSSYTFILTYTEYYETDSGDFQLDTLKFGVVLGTLSEDAYKFMLSYNYSFAEDFLDLPYEFFTEPSVIYQNIKNGYGIFAGLSTDTIFVDIPIK